VDYSSHASSYIDASYACNNEQQNRSSVIRFADVFAGLGGFHVALSRLGMECVFSSELDQGLRDLYHKNFGLIPEGDIRLVDEKKIPKHELLCAGFPCQPFSIAGKKKGDACPSSGKLINDVLRIAAHHLPKYIMLENVPNILTIQNGEFWNYIKKSFSKLGYVIDYKVYSPHQFGIPQKRKRVFVVASRVGLDHFVWPTTDGRATKKLSELIIHDDEIVRRIEPAKLKILNNWQQLVNEVNKMSCNSIVASEFGATYPINDFKKTSLSRIRKMKGSFGRSLADCKTWADVMMHMPHYIQDRSGKIPDWLLPSIVYSRRLYTLHPNFLDEWKQDLIGANNSWQKLEWRGLRSSNDIWKHTIQFRASGIRIIKPEFAPSLVAMTPTQTPIIGAKKRYMGIREAAALQSLDSLQYFPEKNGRAFRALGNAVNAFIVGEIAMNLIH